MRKDDEIYVGGYQGDDQLEPADSLAGDLGGDPLDAGYSPPEREPAALRRRFTTWDEWRGETLTERLAEEEAEVGETDLDLVDQDDRAGRLVVIGTDFGQDFGPAGWAMTAEEAAMHIIEV